MIYNIDIATGKLPRKEEKKMNKRVEYSCNLNLRLTPELRDKLARVAAKNQIRQSELIRQFIRNLEE